VAKIVQVVKLLIEYLYEYFLLIFAVGHFWFFSDVTFELLFD